jgi:uncharacterized protein with GYD domain
MPVYITLVSFTQQGVENIKEGPARLDQVKQAIRAAGGEMYAFYLTMGRYDAMTISEAPSDEVYAATLLAIASAGAVRTETLRAFTEDEYRGIIASIP